MAGVGGFVANYNSLEELYIPPNLMIRPGGDEFLLYDSGPGVGRILLFGAEANIAAIRSATVWAADGNFKVCPELRAQLYAIHALVDGYPPPRVYTRSSRVSPWTCIRPCGSKYDNS